jgi:hypothetical protein
MKNIKIIKLFLVLGLSFSMFSCEKWIDPDININPGKPTEVSVDLLLPSAQAEVAFQLGGDLMRPECMWIQQLSGVDRQSATIENFVFREADVNNTWYFAMYSGGLMDISTLIKKANEEGSPHYSGVGRVLMAYTLGIMTDLFGDIPYSEAFLGAENLTPIYDTQEAIYQSIMDLCDQALIDLVADESLNSPDADDLMYGGDLQMWQKAAYSVKARYALHSSKISSSAYTNALGYLANGISDNGGNLQFNFGPGGLEENPMYQFDLERSDIRCGKKLIDLMYNGGVMDPRLPQYAMEDADGGYSGSAPGANENGASFLGPAFADAAAPVYFLTYAEMAFIKAECLFKTGDASGAATAYNDGLKASLEQFGVFDQVWYDANILGADLTFEQITWGKYIACAFQSESFVDLRRTNMLNTTHLDLPANHTLAEWPRRFPYPTSERNYNSENVPNVTLTTRMWWDIQ